jgi:hypothetical protein
MGILGIQMAVQMLLLTVLLEAQETSRGWRQLVRHA